MLLVVIQSSVLSVIRDDLHRLTIKQIIAFKAGVSSFKAKNGLAPSNLAEMYVPVSSNSALRRKRLASAGRSDVIIQNASNI